MEGIGLSAQSGVAIKVAALDAVVAHALAARPDECCGMLVGSSNRIDEAWRARNISDRPATRFLIDPADHFAALKDARRRGLDVVGFYHSHPRSSAEPSATDLSEASYPDHLFLIVGCGGGEANVRLFRFVGTGLTSGGNFQPTPFVRVP